MTQYDTVNANLSESKLNKLKSAAKILPLKTLKLSSNMINDTNFSHKLLLPNR